MNNVFQFKLIGPILYAAAIVCGFLGIALNLHGNVRVGTTIIALAIVLLTGTAVQLGHLKKW